jgi:hypothetical protein
MKHTSDLGKLIELLNQRRGPCVLSLYRNDGPFWTKVGEVKVTEALIEQLRAPK